MKRVQLVARDIRKQKHEGVSMFKLLALLLALFLTCAAQAQSTDQFFFADEVVGVYAGMREALSQPAAPANLEGTDVLKFVMANSVRQGNDYRMQQKRIEKYNKAKDEGIRQATALLLTGIFMVESANEAFTKYLETVLNNPKMLLQQGTFSRKLAELTDDTEHAWQTYAKAASGVTFALTDIPRPRNIKDLNKVTGERQVNILLTKPEIDLLKAHLDSSFGPVLADNSQAKWADMPAMVMWKFLNDKWIPAVEK